MAKKILLAAFIAITVFSACKKDADFIYLFTPNGMCDKLKEEGVIKYYYNADSEMKSLSPANMHEVKRIMIEAYKNNTVSTIKKQIDTLANLLLDTAVVNKWNAGPKKAWITKTTDPITGEVSYGVNAASGTAALKIRPAIRSGAIWNFMFVKHDDSKGIHNKAYAAMLLRASIDEMKNVN